MEQYIGTIVQMAFNWVPIGWFACEGQILNIANNEPLYATIGNTYGGDSIRTFQLPDLRKKKSDGSYYLQGETMEDGTPFIQSYICYEGVFPTRAQ